MWARDGARKGVCEVVCGIVCEGAREAAHLIIRVLAVTPFEELVREVRRWQDADEEEADDP